MWKRTLELIAVAATLVSAETSMYSDANRTLYDSPRNRAMGGSLMAISQEPMPSGIAAGIAKTSKSVAYLGYTGFFANTFGATTVGFTHPVDSIQGVGGSVSYLLVPGVDSITLENNGSDVPGAMSNNPQTASELCVNLDYGRKIVTFKRGEITAGGAVHVKRIRLIETTGYGIGADLSVKSSFKGGASVALKLENAFTEYSYWTKEYHENSRPRFYFGSGLEKPLNRNTGVSLAYRSPDLFGNSGVGGGSFGKKNQFSGEPEFLSVKQKPLLLLTSANYGAEFLFHQKVAIRAGWADTKTLSFGGGVKLFDRWGVDFVYAHSSALDGTYSLATKLEF